MNYKKNILKPHFSLNRGCLFTSALQTLSGILAWGAIKYQRPLMHTTNVLVIITFFLSASFGLYAIWKRSKIITWLYKLQVGGCLTLILLICMDLLDVLPLFPIQTPVTTILSNVSPTPLDSPMYTQKLQSSRPLLLGTMKHLKDLPLNQNFLLVPTPQMKFTTPKHVYQVDGLYDNNIFLKAPRLTQMNHRFPHYFDSREPYYLNDKEELKYMRSASPTKETEGQTEEVSRDELPPEVQRLSKNMQQSVSATAKIIKHVIKFILSGILSAVFIFQIYCTYIVFTFLLNKCTSVDELLHQPEQFEPIVQADSTSSSFTGSTLPQ